MTLQGNSRTSLRIKRFDGEAIGQPARRATAAAGCGSDPARLHIGDHLSRHDGRFVNLRLRMRRRSSSSGPAASGRCSACSCHPCHPNLANTLIRTVAGSPLGRRSIPPGGIACPRTFSGENDVDGVLQAIAYGTLRTANETLLSPSVPSRHPLTAAGGPGRSPSAVIERPSFGSRPRTHPVRLAASGAHCHSR